MIEGRQTFQGLAPWEVVLWYALVALSIGAFLWAVLLLGRKYASGSGPRSLERPLRRAVRTAATVLSHATIRRGDRGAAFGHVLAFYGFVVLFIGSAVLAFQDDIVGPLFHVEFWRGRFYLGYSLVLDVFGAGLIVGTLVMAAIRGIARPRRLDYARPHGTEGAIDRARYVSGDRAFLGGLLVLAVTGFLLEGLRIAELDPPFEVWSPVGWTLGRALRAMGVGGTGAEAAHHALWWIHGVVALGFVSLIPLTKAVHMITGPSALLVKDAAAGTRLPPAARPPAPSGYARLRDVSWRHLLDLDACTKCGRCHAVCPATASGQPLSPRDLVLDLRELAEGALGFRAAAGIQPVYASAAATLLEEAVKPETVWSCMACMACVEVCPVGIEHVPIINQMRRHLVESGTLDTRLRSTLETIQRTGNSFGEPRRKRGSWTRSLPFAVKDIRSEPAEYLWFVGDYASFDPRCQRATRALARTLHHAGVDFGILYDGERNSGADVRRVGEEGLYGMLAEANGDVMSRCDFTAVISADPHSFHALKNEYPSLAGRTVLHHSELLVRLFASAVLRPAKRLGRIGTYHDPCMLGRYGRVFDAPREVLRAVGIDLREMPRNRESSFCCGAGGGRIWMQERLSPGARRPSEQRIDEAVALGGIEYFVVACPKDVTMYEDAIKTSGHEGAIEVRELAELVWEALGVDDGGAAPA